MVNPSLVTSHKGTPMNLGHWSVIDIETTGINPGVDEIIDLGFLQFEGTKLVRKFSSLVRPHHEISPFISKLTGITNKMLSLAPPWEKVEIDLVTLESHSLIAHNARFEESYLKRYFDDLPEHQPRESFQDSMFYLALLKPEAEALNLEYFITLLGIAEREEHRGLSDSIDLLKVLLTLTYLTYYETERRLKLKEIMMSFNEEDFWFKKFFFLSQEELQDIAFQIDFELETIVSEFLHNQKSDLPVIYDRSEFSLEFNGQNLQKILRSEDKVQKVLPYYRYREAQEALSLRVGQAFKNKIHALIQAPTGTGKTMGYLLPSLLFAMSENETCLVATGTKTLQDQALAKDIPQVKNLLALGDDIKIVRLVGSNNHLCELIFRENDDNNLSLLDDFETTFVKAYFEMFFFYNQHQSYHGKLTREQIHYVLKRIFPAIQEKENELAVDYRACVGSSCPLIDQCSYMQGLREAKEAKLIIGNHALMLNWPRSIDKPQYIVVDEAHRLEGEATKAYAVEISNISLDNFSKYMTQGMGALNYLLQSDEHDPHSQDKMDQNRERTHSALRILSDHIEPLKDLMEAYFKKLPNYSPIYSNELPFPKKEELKDSLSTTIYHSLESIFFVFSDLYTLFLPYMNRWDHKEFKNNSKKLQAWALFESSFGHLEKLTTGLKHCLETPVEWSTIMKFSESEGYVIESSPIDVGKMIHEELLSPSSSVVFTSATLGNASGDSGVQSIEWMTGYTYLTPEKRFKQGLFLDAVYDYRNKSRVYLSSDTRRISDPLFVPELLETVNPLIKDLGGRTLLLFSSRQRFERAVEILLKEFEGKIPVFVQGLGKNVIEEFKKEESAILIGMESFGEGIDIPGEKLQFIVIDKIPDVRQDLVIQRRRDFFDNKFGNEFHDYFLAHRTRSLHQKFGRLLRSENDHGAILVVDNRIKSWKGGTLRSFQKLMEPYEIRSLPIKEACSEIREYFKV